VSIESKTVRSTIDVVIFRRHSINNDNNIFRGKKILLLFFNFTQFPFRSILKISWISLHSLIGNIFEAVFAFGKATCLLCDLNVQFAQFKSWFLLHYCLIVILIASLWVRIHSLLILDKGVFTLLSKVLNL
jgi:hypothetical protein